MSAGSVAAMSPKYPKYRNALIILLFVLVVLSVLLGIHLASKAVQKAVWDFVENPVSGIISAVTGSDRYETCREFVRQNQGRFAAFGENLELTPMRHELRVINGKKTATVVARVSGTRGSGNVTFELKKDNDRWQVREVRLHKSGE
jgi:hypothetical protein